MLAWVVVLLLVYLTAGGLLFQFLETHPNSRTYHLQPITDNCLSQLWTITEKLNVLYERNWTRLVDEQLRLFEARVAEAMKNQHPSAPGSVDLHWSFPTSLLYSLTIITTIGYGNVGPKTIEGKIATMVYALVGVPLMLCCLSHLGCLLAEGLRSCYSLLATGTTCCRSKCCCSPSSRPSYPDVTDRLEMGEIRTPTQHGLVVGMRGGCGRAVCRLTALELDQPSSTRYHSQLQLDTDEDDEDDQIYTPTRISVTDTPSRRPLIRRGLSNSGSSSSSSSLPKIQVPHSVTLAILASYLALGAWLLSKSQPGITYLEALFAVFTAMATISLGDLAARPGQGLDSSLTLALYIILGLTLVAMAFSLAQDAIVSRARALARPTKSSPDLVENETELSV